MLALDIEAVKKMALVIVVALVVAALIMAFVIKNVVGKIISVLLLVGLSLGAWTQRNRVEDCVTKVQAGTARSTDCTFFGATVKIPAIKIPKLPSSTTTTAG